MSEQDIYTGDEAGIIYPTDGSDAGNEAGASGQDSGGGISQGGMIAIIVVVVAVSVIGSTSEPHFSLLSSPPFLLSLHAHLTDTISLPQNSRLSHPILRREKEGMEGPREHPQVGEEGRHSTYAPAHRVP